MVRFSTRVPGRRRPTRLAALRARLGEPPFDLTTSNPTNCGFPYPRDLLAELADPVALEYHPEPKGLFRTREAVAASHSPGGCPISPNRVFLTASSSEAYGFLFRLLAEPGDSVLVPTPSYPLLDHLAGLDGLGVVPYPLVADDGWRPDLGAIEAAPDRCRALVVVHPNNPTGSLVPPDDARRLAELCRHRDWALVADEVFLPYRLDPRSEAPISFARDLPCLGFTLGGLSKSVGLPQAKLGWIILSGPSAEVNEAADRLEFIADAYLSVSGPVANAAPTLIERGQPVRAAILERCRTNLDELVRAATRCTVVDVLRPQGGWSAVVRVPEIIDDEELCLLLLEGHGVAVHPGYLFDFPGGGYLVLSLLPPPEIFREGIERLFDVIERLVLGGRGVSDT